MSACQVSQWSNRICERGTKGCTKVHDNRADGVPAVAKPDLLSLIVDLRMAVTKQCMSPSESNCKRIDAATEAIIDAATGAAP